ncbi:LLM class flavin-dependent oxidoreductase [Pseudomonas putida]|uniref:LLM class flavin-dependent oxidoreductase n=1 Tax=Pseudomonas putida TaxID=303 RepID=UPI00335F482B
MLFSTWATSGNGGFLRANVPQNTDGSYTYNIQLAQAAEASDFFGLLVPVRYLASNNQAGVGGGHLDPLTLTAALAVNTSKLRLLTAVLPGFVPPATMAKAGATLDQISQGRWHINLVSGWFKQEQERLGIAWGEHSERYRRSTEYLQVLKGLWTQDDFSFEGQFYQVSGATMRPRPVQQPYPPIFQGGNSQAAQQMAGENSDWYFINGGSEHRLREQIAAVRGIAAEHGRRVRFAANAFVIARDTESQARAEYDEIIVSADESAIAQFRENAKEAKGMWQSDASLDSFVAINEGLRTGLIGSHEQVAERIALLESLGIEMLLLTFRYPLNEIPLFHQRVATLLNPSNYK